VGKVAWIVGCNKTSANLFCRCYFARDIIGVIQNLFAPQKVFLYLLSPTQLHLPLSPISTYLSSSISKNYKGNLCKSIDKSTMNQCASTNLRFVTCQENYVTMIQTSKSCVHHFPTTYFHIHFLNKCTNVISLMFSLLVLVRI
jgi:hypothetical protein